LVLVKIIFFLARTIIVAIRIDRITNIDDIWSSINILVIIIWVESELTHVIEYVVSINNINIDIHHIDLYLNIVIKDIIGSSKVNICLL